MWLHGEWRSESCLQRRHHLEEDVFFHLMLCLLVQPKQLLRPHSILYQLIVSIWRPGYRPSWHMLAIRHQRSYRKWHQGMNVLTLLFDFFIFFFWKYGKMSCSESFSGKMPWFKCSSDLQSKMQWEDTSGSSLPSDKTHLYQCLHFSASFGPPLAACFHFYKLWDSLRLNKS